MADPTPRSLQPFRWRDIVTIDEAFTPEQRQRIEQSFDAITRAQDNDGIALIQTAAQKCGGNLHIAHTDQRTAAAVFGQGVLMNMELVDRMQVREDGRTRPLSLTGILVHELYHLTDDRLSAGTRLQVREGVSAETQTLLERFNGPEIQSELKAPTANATMRWLAVQAMVSSEEDRNSFIEAARENGMIHLADMLETTDPLLMRRSLQDAGIVTAQGIQSIEADATAYTDAFMRKNFGNQEPQRGAYDNLIYGIRNRSTATPHNYSYASPDEGFGSRGFGTPSVQPVSVEQANTRFKDWYVNSPTTPVTLPQATPDQITSGLLSGDFDLSALRSVTSDDKPYSAADIGSFAPATTQTDRPPARDSTPQR